MILHLYGCVFIHVPKTGGVSISNVLEIPRKYQGHTRLKDHKNHPDDYFKFCFVRNPWDRFVSCYFYFKEYGRGDNLDRHNGEIVNSFSSFDEFVRSFSVENNKFRGLHFHDQIHFFDEKINFVGKFENLQEDFNFVCEKINVPCQKLPHKNKSNHNHYTDYYNDETRKLVGKIYSNDIEAFGYKFE